MPNQGWRTLSALLFTHSWKEKIWIHTFPKGVSAMWTHSWEHNGVYTFPKGVSAMWTHSWEHNGVYTFRKGICPKVNVIARLEYELAYYNSAVHRFNHYTTRTPFNHNNAAVLMISTYTLISKSSSLFINPFAMVPSVPITNDINLTFMFHSFFSYLARSRYLSLHSFSFKSTLWSAGRAKSTIIMCLVDYHSAWSSGRDLVICLKPKIPEKFMRLIFQVVDIPLVRIFKFIFLAQFPWIAFATQSCLVLYSLCANLLHSLI